MEFIFPFLIIDEAPGGILFPSFIIDEASGGSALNCSKL